MKFDVLQILGAVLTVAGAQGAIRLLLDHTHYGLLGWLDAGFAGTLVCYLVATAIGVVLAGWAHDRAKALGRRK
ncbi:hypothetical protein M8542_12805 [Amycolatopsis sp. OK19-0408]|uniref:Uncharacterized protein n=1 Tax=Amycolatopsis iheyensis TaxID=2945988 RepID=A0A9X2SIG1_9PSEU|nr:hypothetical protein [Amycolatopsis iheyensis]MCR6483697.1 hypothetical protein [Amycolatopsis iheyensis]